MSDLDKCHICGNNRKWHADNAPKHSFVLMGQSEGGTAQLSPNKAKDLAKEKAIQKQKTQVVVRDWPHDPILRIALVNKGILTLADIETAEQSMREAAEHGQTVVLHGANDDRDTG